MKSEPKAILFDIGRVIIRVQLERALDALGQAARLAPDDVWNAIRSDPKMLDFQEGRLTPQEWHAYLTQRFRMPLTYLQFCNAWNSALDPEPILKDELFAALAQRCRLALVSNTDPIHVAHIERSFTFPRYFPSRVYSCDAGTSKPAPEIFRRAVQAAGAAPAETIFIDDVPEYVTAAQALGLDGIVFQGAEKLTGELRGRALLD